MKSAHVVWRSHRKDGRPAVEIASPPSDPNRLAERIEAVLDRAPASVFLVLRVSNPSELNLLGISAAIDTMKRRGSVRLCVAGQRRTLAAIADFNLNCEQIGLMLDDVYLETPLSELLWDRIEAVRFSPEFVTGACKDLRQACALEAMLSLCSEIGMCTLGIDGFSTRMRQQDRFGFDFVRDDAEADEKSPARSLSNA